MNNSGISQNCIYRLIVSLQFVRIISTNIKKKTDLITESHNIIL